MRETITKKEYLQVVGLMTLALKYTHTLEECETAIAEVLGVEKDSGSYGHVSDAIYAYDGDVDGMLKRLGIGVNKK